MLAHAASAQGISAVENICGRKHTLNHLSVPAACFTPPEGSFVGRTEENAREQAEKAGYTVKSAVTKTSFKAYAKVGFQGFITPGAVVDYLVRSGECLLIRAKSRAQATLAALSHICASCMPIVLL